MKKVIIPFVLLVIVAGVFFLSSSELADRLNPFLKAQNLLELWVPQDQVKQLF